MTEAKYQELPGRSYLQYDQATDVDLGQILVGATRSFTMYYGATPTAADAASTLTADDADTYTLIEHAAPGTARGTGAVGTFAFRSRLPAPASGPGPLQVASAASEGGSRQPLDRGEPSE